VRGVEERLERVLPLVGSRTFLVCCRTC
jgi:acetolactate synthase regulatory subunit